MGTLAYRFTVVNPAAVTPYVPGMTSVPSEHWSVTSVRGDARPFIESPPDGDGQEIDLLTGQVQDGAYRVRVLDLPSVTGGGVEVNEEFNDNQLYARWAQNAAGISHPGGWGFGFLEYPGVPPSSIGATVGGSMTVVAGARVWIQRTFTGLTPSTAYTATVRYFNRGCSSVLGFYPGAPAQNGAPFLEINGVIASGGVVGPPLATWPSNPAASYLSLSGTSDASGTLTVLVGMRFGVACAVFSWVLGFDWVHLVPGAPASVGRYVTVNLADGVTRQQFLGRAAFIEESYDEGATWPRMLFSGFVTALQMPASLVYEFSVGDSRRVERVSQAFQLRTSTFTNITCLIGGPTHDGWAPLIPYFGRPKFRIEYSSATFRNVDGSISSQGEVILQYVSGPMPEAYRATGDNLTRANFDVINDRARPFWVQDATVPLRTSPVNTQWLSSGHFPRLLVEVLDINSIWPAGTSYDFTPWSWRGQPRTALRGMVAGLLGTRPWEDFIMGEGGRIRIPWDYGSPVIPPVVGEIVELAIFPLDVSEDAPLHLSMHPVDIVAGLYADAGIVYDTTSMAATRAALGEQLECRLRISQTESVQSFIERLFGTFDFSTRIVNSVRVFFTMRRKTEVAPAETVIDSTLREEGGPTFDLSLDSKCNQVTLTQRRFTIAPEADPLQRPWDDLEEIEQVVVADLVASWGARTISGSVGPRSGSPPTLDAETYGEREQTYSIPGQLWVASIGELSVAAFARGLAEAVFDRHGRGLQMTTVVTRRDAGLDDVEIGDEVVLDVSHLPNAQFTQSPTSQRGGGRRGTVKRRVSMPEGPEFVVVDAGTLPPAAYNIAPDTTRWSLSLPAANPGYALLDLTTDPFFAPTLAQANARVEVEIGFGSQPADHGIHYTTIDPAELAFDAAAPSAGGDYKVALGPWVVVGALYVRLRTFIPGTVPGAWSGWQTVTTTPSPVVGTISALVFGTPTESTVDASWTTTDTVQNVTVEIRITGTTPWLTVAVLPPGSAQLVLTGLTAATQYDVRVSLDDGQAITGSFTTAASTGTLVMLPPILPGAFSDGMGTYGLRVIAQQAPCSLRYEVAVETGVATGVPGAFVEFAVWPGVLGTYVSGTGFAPDDGLRRYLRARATWPGYVDSTYTSTVSIRPYSTTIPALVGGSFPVLVAPGATPPALSAGAGLPGISATGAGSWLPSFGSGGAGGWGGGGATGPGSAGAALVPVRYAVQMGATGVASNAEATGTVWVSRGSMLYRAFANVQCRIRLYETAADRTADTARAAGTEPYSGDGLVLDVILADSESRDLRLSPRVPLGSTERDPAETNLYYAMTNLTGSTADLLAELDLTPIET